MLVAGWKPSKGDVGYIFEDAHVMQKLICSAKAQDAHRYPSQHLDVRARDAQAHGGLSKQRERPMEPTPFTKPKASTASKQVYGDYVSFNLVLYMYNV